MTRIADIRDNIRHKTGLARRIMWRYGELNPAMEAVYRDLFVRDLRSVGIDDIFYPVGGAASHSLLYLLLRTMREFAVGSVLELGAGQSTLLFHAARATLRRDMDVTTVEHDAAWAARVRSQVAHSVVHAPLAAMSSDGKDIGYYSGSFLPADKRFNLVVVDGPPAHDAEQRFARVGCLTLLPGILADDFMLVVDDAEREGEAHLVTRLAEMFRAHGFKVHEAAISAMKKQVWFCGGSYAHAAFF